MTLNLFASDPAVCLLAIAKKWRAEGLHLDKFHCTMGIGWKTCADELEAEVARLFSDAKEPR